MERVSKAAGRALSSGSAKPPTNGSASSVRISREGAERAAKAWDTLTEMYGSAFTSQYGDRPPELWLLTIANLRDEELAEGFRRLAMEGRTFPPNLSELVNACRPKRGVRYLGRPTTPKALALPVPRADEAHRAACLERIRKAVAGAVVERVPHTERATWNKRACTCKAQGTCDTCRWFSESA